MDKVVLIPVPSEHAILTCRYCGVKIFFARTPAMRDMPLEVRPVLVYRVPPLGPGEKTHRCVPVEETAFLPHWGRCPGAEKARREDG